MLTVASMFDRVMTQLATLSATGWSASTRGFDDFAQVSDGAQRTHKSYVVAVPSTVPLAGRQVLSSAAPGALQRSEVVVRWLYVLRVGNRTADLSAALTAEAELRACVLATGPNPQLRIALDPAGATRRELPSSTGPVLLGEIPFLVRHAIPLA